MKRTLFTALLATVGLALLATMAPASAQSFFRINTGGTAGTYYPIGGLIANAISQPTVPNLVATSVASNGSVANVNAIQSGGAESGFSQADVAYWAYTGTGTYEGKPKVTDLRLIANLYAESFHLVVRKGANIKTFADLKGKRVSLDEPGSGTIVNARAILAAYGITEKDIKQEFLKPNAAGEKLKDNSLDAFFFVGGYPAGAIAGAQWVTSANQDATLVYNITKALWSDNTRKALDAGHAKGKSIVRAGAIVGAGIPIHAGAEKFYKEVGLLK